MESSRRIEIVVCPQCGGSHITPFFTIKQGMVIEGIIFYGYGLCSMTGAWLFLEQMDSRAEQSNPATHSPDYAENAG